MDVNTARRCFTIIQLVNAGTVGPDFITPSGVRSDQRLYFPHDLIQSAPLYNRKHYLAMLV